MHPRHLPQHTRWHGRPVREPDEEEDLRYGLADIQRDVRSPCAPAPKDKRRRRRAPFPRGWYQELERLV